MSRSHKPLRLFTQGSCKSDKCGSQWLNLALSLSMECSKFKVPCLVPGVGIGPSQCPAYRVCVQWWPGKSDIFISQKSTKRYQQFTWLCHISTPSPFRPPTYFDSWSDPDFFDLSQFWPRLISTPANFDHISFQPQPISTPGNGTVINVYGEITTRVSYKCYST